MQVSLSTPDAPIIAEVGGKAASLIRLRRGGFKVPDGIVLTTAFFAPWIEHVEATGAWRSVIAMLNSSRTRLPNLNERERLARACDDIKR